MDDADFLRSYHKWATITWATVGAGLSVLWASWIPWVVFMSLYANVAGEWSAWQSSRIETQQNEPTICHQCQHHLDAPT